MRASARDRDLVAREPVVERGRTDEHEQNDHSTGSRFVRIARAMERKQRLQSGSALSMRNEEPLGVRLSGSNTVPQSVRAGAGRSAVACLTMSQA
jgi:hypothetical protein